ncbi:MAG: haloalkane dehalogenase [Pseudomonadales bacterium]|nr:haloalkane dehalogenase [Pseudomonadales bacterium]
MFKFSRRNLLQGSLALGGAAAAPLAFRAEKAQAQSPDWASQKRKVRVRDLDMAYYEIGSGDPIIFLHGNPTSSYLWRNVIPHVQHLGRCIAPDMIGMGDSDPLPNSGAGAYKFAVHRDYMFDLFEAIGATERVVLVIHDWGSGVGLSYAERHPERVRGLAFMEAILRPRSFPQTPEPTQGPFATFRSPAGEQAVLQNNVFVEQLLIGGLGYYLSEADKAEYRRPYLTPGESRRPTLEWPRELPLGGKPADTQELVMSYTEWLHSDSRIPKLFVRANPGAILANQMLLDYVREFKNQKEVMVYGSHYVQEMSPHAVGRALAEWLGTLA